MLVFILRRLLAAIPVLFGITVLVLVILHLIPGDPAQILLFCSGATRRMWTPRTSSKG